MVYVCLPIDELLTDIEKLKAKYAGMSPNDITSAAIHRINDLTLRVTAPDGTVYWGNHGLLDGNWSTPGGTRSSSGTSMPSADGELQ